MKEADILLIQETSQAQDALSANLKQWGYSSQRSSAAAWQRSAIPADRKYKLVLLDTDHSWEETAYSLARKFRATSVPVLLLVDGDSDAEGQDDQAFAILRRPYQPHQLLRLLERTITAAELQTKSARLLERLQDFTRTGYWEWAPGMTTPAFSAALHRLVGIQTSDSGSGMEAFLALVHPDDADLVRKRHAALESGTPFHLEYRIIRPDGALRYIRDSSFSEPPGDDQRPRMFGFLQDITEERHCSEALAQCRQEMDEFAHIASHDLQEPLRAMTGFMQLLKSRYGDQLDDKGSDFINRACRAGNRMELLIKELLQLARINTRGAPFEPAELDDILEGVRQQLAASMGEKNIHISSCSLPQLQCDSRQLATLFHNLLENGLKFNTSDTPKITIDCRQEGDIHHFTIADNGIGIAPEFHQRIFTVFQRLHTEKEYPGLGTGLTKAKKIVERHGGSVWLESEPDRGSIIHFTLAGSSPSPR